MRVVLGTSARTIGGVWRHLADLSSGLDAAGIDVALALVAEARELRVAAEGHGIEVVDLHRPTSCDVFHLHLSNTFDRSAPLRLVRWHRRCSAIVVTEHLPRSDASDPLALPGATTRVGAQEAKTIFKRGSYSLVRTIITVSDANKRFILERFGVDPSKVASVPLGIIRTEPPPTDAPRAGHFVALGSVIMQKGYDVLVEASSRSQARWTVDVFGEGPHRDRLRRMADAAGGRVRFRGHTNDPHLQLDAAEGIVIPSRWEGGPYVMLEAMDRGRAVVASDIDGIADTVVDGSTGLLVPPDDPARLAAALDRLSLDLPLAQRLGRAGRVAVAGRDLETMVNKTIAIYESDCRHVGARR